MMMALDAGAEDFASEEEVFIVTTSPEDFGTVREALEAEGLEFLEAAVKMIPDTETAINEDDAKKFQKCLTYLKMTTMFKKCITMLNSLKDGMNRTL